MEDLQRKLRVIWNPFLFTAAGFIPLYTFLNWLLIVKTETIAVDADIVNYYLPAILAAAAVFFMVRPGINMLNRSALRFRAIEHIYFAAVVAIAAPTVILQLYVEEASGTVLHLDNVYQIGSAPLARYYTFEHYAVDKTKPPSSYMIFGKARDQIQFFFACPILARAEDTSMFAGTDPKIPPRRVYAWVGVKTSSYYHGSLPETYDASLEWHAYVAFGHNDPHIIGFGNTQYLERMPESEDLEYFRRAILHSKRYSSNAEPIVLKEMYDRFDERTGAKPAWALLWFVGGAVFFFGLTVRPKFADPEPREQQEIIRGKPIE